MGKVTGDIVSSISGTVRSVSGIMTIGAGIGGTVGGALASTTGAGALAGVPVMVVSGSAIAAGNVELAQGVGVVYSSLGNLGKDLSEFRKKGKLIGQNGTQVSSKTIWQHGSTERLDVENPAPGRRAGQIHYHESDGTKWYYDIAHKVFVNEKTGEKAPIRIQKLLNDSEFRKAVEKALKYLGE